jgi:hypothetical protein
MPDTNINLKAKDDASLALQGATDRLKALRSEIDGLRGKGDLSALDVKNINAMTAEANRLERGLNGVSTGLNGVSNQARGTASALGGIVPVIDVMDFVGFAGDVGQAFIALGQMGEESAQLEAKFTSLAGSTSEARNRFTAMDEAVGNWLTRDAKMETSMRIMSLGLADSAAGAGELARTAITLGDSTQSAEQRIQSFTQMLATGQTRGLATFGISIIAVKDRVKELQAADESLSTAMATQQAISEAAAVRMQELGDYMPITATEQMANTTADLKDSLGDLVAEPYIVSVKFLTTGIENLQSLLNRTSNDPNQKLSGLDKQIANAKAELEGYKAQTGQGILGGLFNQKVSPEEIAKMQGYIDELVAKQQYLAGVTATTGDAGVANLERQKTAAAQLKDGLQAAEDQYLALEEAGKTKEGETEEKVDPVQARLEKLRAAAEATRVNEEAMRLFRLETEKATGAVSALSDATTPKTGAKPEDSKTKVDAAGLVKDLQKGLFAPEVIGAIDVDKLAAEPGMAGLARKSFEAFSKAMEANKGNTNVADMLLSMQANDKGVTPADTAAAKAINTLSSAIGVQVKGKDFAGTMIGYGETVWGYTETGMIQKAQKSTAFQQAINAMVAAAIAGALQ